MAAGHAAGLKIKSPYNIILAGDHEAGKTTIFETLRTCFEEGSSGKFQLLQGRKELRFESCQHKYLDSSGRRKMKLCLWDTGGMERVGGAMSMTRTYFRQVIVVILVYDTLNMASFNKLRAWVKMAQETCEYKDHLIYALWGNERARDQSTVNNPVDEDAVACLLGTDSFSMIDSDLVCRFNGKSDRERVEEEYEKLVRQLEAKMREIDRKLDALHTPATTDCETDADEAPQGLVLHAAAKTHAETEEKSRACGWC